MLDRTDLVLKRPRFFELSPVGDYPLMILLALQGSVHYIDNYMSAYRVGVEGSWSKRTYANSEKTIKHFERTLEMLEELNQYTNHQYVESIDIRKNQILFNLNLVQNKFDQLKSSQFKPYYRQLSLTEKLSVLIRHHFPGVYGKLKQLKGA